MYRPAKHCKYKSLSADMKTLLVAVLLFSSCFWGDSAWAAPSLGSTKTFFAEKAPAGIASAVSKVRELEKRVMSGSDPAALKGKFQAAESELKSLRSANTPGLYDEIDAALGYLYELWGKQDQAVSAYQKSLAARSNQADVLFRYGHLLRLNGDLQAAQAALEEARWRKTHYAAEVEYELGECALALKAPEKAAAQFAKARALDPHMAQANQKLYSVSKSLSQTAAKEKSAAFDSTARSLLGEVAAQQTDQVRTRDYQAQIILQSDPLGQRQQLEQAVQTVETLAYNSNCSDDQTVRVAINGALKLRQVDRAERLVTCGLKQKPKSAPLLELQKQIQLERGLTPNK